ncbi:Mitochondrial import receptor subunit TOM40 [Goodea atripinnis]|uniref:Mitochondrial import receptor subunit TOM40 n=1 Tax=Goodea atripinnis TaxID=208336 RepID=A0ABV0NTG7_9TELE
MKSQSANPSVGSGKWVGACEVRFTDVVANFTGVPIPPWTLIVSCLPSLQGPCLTSRKQMQIPHSQTLAHMRSVTGNVKTQQHKFVNWQCDFEYRGQDFTSAVTLGNPDVLVGSGGELVYHRRPGEEGTVTSFLGRYTGDNFVATLTLGGAGAHATYYHKANDQVGVEFEASTRMQDTTTSFGYQLDLPKANLLFKGKYESFDFSLYNTESTREN